MQKLLQGVHRFSSLVFRDRRELFERLADRQSPEALFITCSDSRVLPNLLTQTEPGELFILRNAGNLVPPWDGRPCSAAATVEFAVAGLGVRDIIVCGHTNCGAMKGVLEPRLVESMPAVGSWLRFAAATQRVMDENYRDLEGARRLSACVQENVLVQLENLRTHPVIASRLTAGTLALHGWVYKLETGEVFAYDADLGQFTPLGSGPAVRTPSPRVRASNGAI